MPVEFPIDLSGMRVVRTDAEIECTDIDAALRQAGAQLILLPESIDEYQLADTLVDADLLLMCYTSITARVLAGATRLKGIVKYGVGVDAIDFEAAARQQIPVVNVPDYADNTVAEAALCMTLCLLRKMMPISTAVQQKGWINPVPGWLGQDLSNKCVALVGAGHIGQAFARMAGSGFCASVIAYDPYLCHAELDALGIEKVEDLHSLLSRADVVSVHCVLNEQTRGLIGSAEFAAMQRQPVFINVSRGAIVDEQALIQALDTRQISAAGLDVFSSEPLARHSHPLSSLFGRDNVILYPHLAFYTCEAMERLTSQTLARCLEIMGNEPVRIRSNDPRLRGQIGHFDFHS
ncbi:MAG: 2-hydroxyacid dehydrogenase [Granulosicoccus sp.]